MNKMRIVFPWQLAKIVFLLFYFISRNVYFILSNTFLMALVLINYNISAVIY